jgi:hypothetical protein
VCNVGSYFNCTFKKLKLLKMDSVEKCSIGQIERCRTTGCEWKKAFHEHCSTRKPVEIKFVPAEDTKPFFSNRKKSKKKGRVVKDEVKYIEINAKPVKKEPVRQQKTIKVASTDDWIKKIKVK